jgi:hypothetical protein
MFNSKQTFCNKVFFFFSGQYITLFFEVIKIHKQKSVQKLNSFKNHCLKLSTQTQQNTTVCSKHNQGLQNLQKYFVLRSLHYLQRPRLFAGGSGCCCSGSPVKQIADSRMLGFRCMDHSLAVNITRGHRLVFIICYLLFCLLFVIIENKIIKVTR